MGLSVGTLCISLVLNSFGIVAISLHHVKTNQNIILVLLSLDEIAIAICSIIHRVSEKFDVPRSYEPIIISIKYILGVQLMLAMFILTLDRWIMVLNPLKYRIRVSRRKVVVAIFISSIISIALGLVKLLIKEAENNLASNLITGVGFIYLIFAIIAYSHIIIKIKKSRERFGSNPTKRNKSNIKNDFMTPGLIVLTYIVLYGIPPFIIRFGGVNDIEQKSKTIMINVSKFIQTVGLCIDPILYVLLTKTYRERFANMLLRSRCLPDISSLRSRTAINVAQVDGTVDEENSRNQTTL